MIFILSKLLNYNILGRLTTEELFNRNFPYFLIRKIPYYDLYTSHNQISLLNNKLKRLMQSYSVEFILFPSNLYINLGLIQIIIYPVFGPVN